MSEPGCAPRALEQIAHLDMLRTDPEAEKRLLAAIFADEDRDQPR